MNPLDRAPDPNSFAAYVNRTFNGVGSAFAWGIPRSPEVLRLTTHYKKRSLKGRGIKIFGAIERKSKLP